MTYYTDGFDLAVSLGYEGALKALDQDGNLPDTFGGRKVLAGFIDALLYFVQQHTE